MGINDIGGLNLDTAYAGIYKFLGGPTPTEVANTVIWAGIASLTNAMVWLAAHAAVPISAELAPAAEIMNKIIHATMQPNVGGFPIQATVCRQSRDVDVSEQMIIAQASLGGVTGGKSWITDNAAPRPRVWEIHGYITSILPVVDAYVQLKPSIAAQKEWFDICARSRQPVMFKPYGLQFHRVLIEHVDFTDEPDKSNGLAINMTLREFVPYIAEIDTVTGARLAELQKQLDTAATVEGAIPSGPAAVGAAVANVFTAVSNALAADREAMKTEVKDFFGGLKKKTKAGPGTPK